MAFHRLDVSLEKLLARSFPNAGAADRIRRIFADDIGVDRLEVGARRENGLIRFAFPIMLIVGVKQAPRETVMTISPEERRDAERRGEEVCKRLFQIMDLQGEIDTFLRDKPSSFGSQKWQYADIEALQRLVALAQIQFLLFEPVHHVQGNDEVKDLAEKLAILLAEQLKTLKTRRTDWD